MREPIRLDRRCAELFDCSRGEAVRYIQGGWVLVDGEVVERPNFKVQDQKIELAEGATSKPIKPVTLLFNLPEEFSTDDSTVIQQLITPDSHCEEDYSGIKILNRHFHGLKPVLPLQNGASGLSVYSKDYKVERALLDQNRRKEEEYIIELSDEHTPEVLKQLNEFAYSNDESQPEFKASQQSEKKIRFVTKFTYPDQIETLCKRVGLTTTVIKRIRIGRVSMKKLPSGEWRYLPENTMF